MSIIPTIFLWAVFACIFQGTSISASPFSSKDLQSRAAETAAAETAAAETAAAETAAATVVKRQETLQCRDFLTNGHYCVQIPSVCFNVYGSIACRRFCGGCVGPSPPAQVQPTGVSGTCADNLGHGLSCQQLSGICSDPSGIGPAILCPRYCRHCQDANATSPTTTPSPTTTTPTTTTTAKPTGSALTCVDHITNGQRCQFIPGICHNLYGHLSCHRHCDRCVSSGPQPVDNSTVTPGSCVDNLGHGLLCQELPGVCHDPSGIGPQLLCPKFCSICHTPTTSPPPTNTTTTTTTPPTSATATSPPPPTTTAGPVCEDQLKGTNACANLERTFTTLCQNVNGQKTCAKYCGICKDPPTPPTTTTTTTMTTTTQAKPCLDVADKTVCGLPGFCADTYAHALCQSTCGYCQEACEDSVSNCSELLAAGSAYSSLQELCAEPARAAVCRKTCGGCA